MNAHTGLVHLDPGDEGQQQAPEPGALKTCPVPGERSPRVGQALLIDSFRGVRFQSTEQLGGIGEELLKPSGDEALDIPGRDAADRGGPSIRRVALILGDVVSVSPALFHRMCGRQALAPLAV